MNVFIVGLGSIARKHIKALRAIDSQARILALRSSSDAVIENDIANIYDWAELKEAPDFILISNPTKFHKGAIIRALDFNCPLFIEKPVMSDLEDSNEISESVSKKGLLTYVACNLRFHPCLKYLKTYLTTEKIRVLEVNVYCGSDLSQWRPGTDYSESYSAKAEWGGGVHLDLIHEIDYCYWLFGKPESHSSVKRKVSDLRIDSFDYANYLLHYPHFTTNITLNYYRKKAKRGLEIVTSEGVIYADLLNATILLDNNKIFSDPNFLMEQTYTEQMNYFIQSCKAGMGMDNDFQEALEVLKIALN
jgi:predicted dehydrogenase